MGSLQPNRVFIFDMTRVRSHLFFRYLSTHPDIKSLWHPFLAPFLYGPERVTLRTKNDNGVGHDNGATPVCDATKTYADATSEFLQVVEAAESEGKILAANEHIQVAYKPDVTLGLIRRQNVDTSQSSNPTNIPDHVFANITPIFVIRNPIFSVPSNYTALLATSPLRPGGEDWKFLTDVYMLRRLFDYFCTRDGKPPLVVNGDDVVWRTDKIRDALSRTLHVNPEGFSQLWEAVPIEEQHEDPLIRYFLKTINESTGIERSSEHPPDADLHKAHASWVQKFDQQAADQLRATVEENMPHYEYLNQFKA